MHHVPLRRLRQIIPLLLVMLAQLALPRVAQAFILGQNTRWTSTATNASTGTYGQPITLTWSLIPDGTSILNDSQHYDGIGSSSNLIAKFDSTYGAGTVGGTDYTQRPWFHLFSDSFNRWSQLGGINFVYQPNDFSSTALGSSTTGALGTRGDVRIGGANIDGVDGTLAETLFPNVGDIFVDTTDMSFFSSDPAEDYRAFRNTLMHETGHAFGLEHVISNTSHLLMAPVIDLSFDGPQLDEVRAIQYFYGDPHEKGAGNNSAALATPLGAVAAGGSVEVGSGPHSDQVVNSSDTDFVSVFSTTDSDYYSFMISAATKLSAVLSPRGGVFTQTAQATPQPAPTTFNANNRSDLVLTLFAPDGITPLATVNNAAAGSDETLTGFSLASAGKYYVRVMGTTADAVQLYDLKLSTAAPILMGDYNHDGIVDAADYTVWRDELGQIGSNLAGDGNGDNKVDETDYTIWQANFGKTGSGSGSLAGGTVPEPSTAALAILPLALFVMLRVRRG